MKMTELQDIGTMNYIAYLDALLAAPTDEARSEMLARREAQRAHLPRQWETMPTFERRPRKSIMDLRPAHLHMVEEHGFEKHGYDRNTLGDYFLANYDRLFGSIRKSKAREVPSDRFRKERIVHRLLDLIEGRRLEYSNERAGLPRYHHLENNRI
jgi:hypothetical protein